jgi:hypothetical protein
MLLSLKGGDFMSESEKKFRLCPLQNKKVVCDGFCDVVSVDGKAHICSVREKALDLALN